MNIAATLVSMIVQQFKLVDLSVADFGMSVVFVVENDCGKKTIRTTVKVGSGTTVIRQNNDYRVKRMLNFETPSFFHLCGTETSIPKIWWNSIVATLNDKPLPVGTGSFFLPNTGLPTRRLVPVL